MIKIRLFTWEDDWSSHVAAPERYFNDLLCPRASEEASVPFRDAESISFLETCGVVFADDEDWYSVICDGKRMNIACLDSGIRFGLAAIHRSKQGDYIQCAAQSGWFYEKLLKALGALPMDILVAVNTDEIPSLHWGIPEGVIENYPYQNGLIEVKLMPAVQDDNPFYEKVPSTKEFGPDSELYIGKDGGYYLDYKDSADAALRYYWQNDIEGIIRYIDGMDENDFAIRIGEVRHEYSLFELGIILNCEEERIRQLTDPDTFQIEAAIDRRVREMYGLAEAPQKDKERIKSWESFYELEGTLDFRKRFSVISHLVTLPKAANHLLPMMMVDKSFDGTYLVHGGATVAYPEFSECLEEVVERRSACGECFVLVVDADVLLDRAGDIDNALCGFKVLEDSVEIFDRDTAVIMFGEALKEAYYSGKCEVADRLY